jgi:hypothetical protein
MGLKMGLLTLVFRPALYRQTVPETEVAPRVIPRASESEPMSLYEV